MKMDRHLKEAIEQYVRINEPGITFPEDFANDLEQHLIDEGFDLSCVIQHNY